MDGKLMRAISDFVTQRVNDLGEDAPDAVTDVFTEVWKRMQRLEGALVPKQTSLLRDLENAMSLQVGEEVRHYYRAGFHDAMRFLMDWGSVD